MASRASCSNSMRENYGLPPSTRTRFEPGDHFGDRVEAAIRSAGMVLVVSGPDWLERLNTRVEDDKIDFVQREFTIAVERKRTADGQIELIPILVSGTSMPERHRLHHNLCDSTGPLFDYQALTFEGREQDEDQQLEQLIATIEPGFGIVPSESRARLVEPPVVSIHARTVGAPNADSPRAITLAPIDIDHVERTFHSVSGMLLDWPQEIHGHWIERPELPRRHESITSSSPSAPVLLGDPGEGNSAILARFGLLLAQDGTVLPGTRPTVCRVRWRRLAVGRLDQLRCQASNRPSPARKDVWCCCADRSARRTRTACPHCSGLAILGIVIKSGVTSSRDTTYCPLQDSQLLDRK